MLNPVLHITPKNAIWEGSNVETQLSARAVRNYCALRRPRTTASANLQYSKYYTLRVILLAPK